MDAVNQLLDRCRELRSLPTDMALADALGVTRATVSGWRHGARYPDEIACSRISEITGEPLGRVLGIVGEARAVSADARKVWRRLAEASVFALAALGLTGAPGPATAFPAGSASPGLYIMSSLRRWLRSRLVRFTSPAAIAA